MILSVPTVLKIIIHQDIALASASALGLSAAGDECTERGGGKGAAVLGAGVDAGEGDGANGCVTVSPKEDLKMRRVRRGQLR